jgi:hypothetical protein
MKRWSDSVGELDEDVNSPFLSHCSIIFYQKKKIHRFLSGRSWQNDHSNDQYSDKISGHPAVLSSDGPRDKDSVGARSLTPES